MQPRLPVMQPYPHQYNIKIPDVIDEITALQTLWCIFDLDIYDPHFGMSDLSDSGEVADYARFIITSKSQMHFNTALFTWIMHPGVVSFVFYAEKIARTKICASLFPNCYPTILTYSPDGDLYLHKKFLPMWTQELQSVFT